MTDPLADERWRWAPRWQQAARLRALGWRIGEIARHLDLTVGTVYQALQTARAWEARGQEEDGDR